MDTPRKTNLYRQLAKDYQPKEADMRICKYIEDMESQFRARVAALESKMNEIENGAPKKKTSKTATEAEKTENNPAE